MARITVGTLLTIAGAAGAAFMPTFFWALRILDTMRQEAETAEAAEARARKTEAALAETVRASLDELHAERARVPGAKAAVVRQIRLLETVTG